VVVSSLIFVALHVPDLVEDPVGVIGVVGGVSIFLASILMSFAYLRSGAIWLPIGIHAGHNIALGPVLGINFSGADLSLGWHAIALQGPNALTDGRLGFEIATLSGLVIGIAMMLFFVRRAA
jgi:hypothetical protein